MTTTESNGKGKKMNDDSAYACDASQLAGLIRQVVNDRVDLTDDELRDILREELDAPLLPKARFVTHARARSTQSICWSRTRFATMRHVFADPQPPTDALNVIKEYAKHVRNDPDSAIPQNVCSALYYAAIAAAKSRHGLMISSQEPDTINRGIQWALSQPWITEPLLTVFRSALEKAA